MKIRASAAQTVLFALSMSLSLLLTACNKPAVQKAETSASADAEAKAGAPDTLKVPIISATTGAVDDGPETLRVPIITAP